MSLALRQFLLLYSWFPLAALIIILLLIARFYQKTSGERTFFRWFLVPLVLFGAASVRYASIGVVSGDLIGDITYGLSGLALTVLSVRLYWLMMLQN